MLYLYKEPEGDALLPICLREEHGRHASYLYAATHLSKALAFSFSYHEGEVICNGAVEDSPEEFVIVCGGQKTLEKDRHIRVYGFSNEGFREIDGSRQAVSEQAVFFRDAELVLETKSDDDLMRNGLQIFLMEETAEELMQENFHDQYPGETTEAMLLDLMQNGRARWINHEKNIGISRTLWSRFENLRSQSNPHLDLAL